MLDVVEGRIPGAENVSWAAIVNEDGTYKSLEEIRRIYADKGVDGSRPVITYCRIGGRSSHSWFALKRLLATRRAATTARGPNTATPWACR